MADTVLVIGAGPVGLTMAAELMRYGVNVRIVEKSATRTDKSKALVLWSRTLELLEQAGAVEPFLASGHQLFAANMFSGAHRIARIDFKSIPSRYAYALMLPQSKTEELLEAHLQRLGLTVERQVEALEFRESGDAVNVTLRSAQGETEKLRVSWLIGCDGAHSMVRHGLGLEFEGSTMQTDWVLADVHLKGWQVPQTELATYWHSAGALAAFPISPGRFRIIGDIGPARGERAADPTLAQIQAIVDQRGPGGVTVHDPVWLSGFRINERKVAAYRKGRTFLVGDAAHVHSPAGGQGMNTGMQDAFNLAWKLALVCHDTVTREPLLESYSTERSAVGRKVLSDAGRLTALAMLRNPLAQAVRNVAGGMLLGLPPLREAMAKNFSEIGIHYTDSPLNGPPARGLGGPAPGERVAAMDGSLVPGTMSGGPKFTLHAARSPATDALLARHPDLLAPVPRAAVQSGGAWLVRPDGYVGAVAHAAELKPLDQYLSHLAR